ncbi:MAG: DUF262 domain-containing protein [Alistipes sp.]|nr:DUF262 domain-containing protein [Alistipes sp.]
MSNNNKTSLWHLLDKYEIVIPIIQRDYAQGRKGKEDLRLRLLKSLKNALDGNKEIKLDFVYGSVDNNRMTPLDGQQRLTTLWLLHWFIAFRAGKLMEPEVQDRLKKFYYATRPSSTEFCRRMVEEFGKISKKSIKETSIVEHIKNQHWYYSYYKNDPTIRAILTMIGSNSDKEQKNDCLEQVFNNCDFDCYWKMLTGDNCPIQFYHQDMIGNDVPLVDDLYIKMNARGKQLTHFENFKAELIGYNQDKICNNNDFKLDIAGNEKDQEFVSNLDNSWVNIFWPYRNKYNRVDEIYYKFINQLMLNYYLIKSNTKDIDKTPLYRLFMNDNTFHKIEDYAEVLDDSFKSMLLNTLNGVELCNIKQGINDYIKGEILSGYNQFAFIPEYKNNGNDNDNDQDNLPTTELTQIQQVLFFAICRFLEKWSESNNYTPFPEDGLKDWVRFCHNISYNPLVNTVEGLQGALRVIDEISGKRNIIDIYDLLASFGSYNAMELNSQVASEQIEEEIIKAKYQQQEPKLKAKFIEAEKYSFFKGCIRFLLWDDKGEYKKDFFYDKFKNATEKFKTEDTLEGKIKSKKCFVEYFCSCTRLEDIISNDNNGNNCIRFNNSGEAWKYMLSNKELCAATHNFLCNTNASQNGCSIEPEDEEDKERLNYVKEIVCKDEFIKKLEKMGDIVSGVLFLRRNYEWALYPKNAKADKKVIVLGTSRNSVLKQLLGNNEIITNNNIAYSSLFYGWDIPFTYNEKEFLWKWNNVIVHNEKTIEISYNSTYEAIKQKLDEAVTSN